MAKKNARICVRIEQRLELDAVHVAVRAACAARRRQRVDVLLHEAGAVGVADRAGNDTPAVVHAEDEVRGDAHDGRGVGGL